MFHSKFLWLNYSLLLLIICIYPDSIRGQTYNIDWARSFGDISNNIRFHSDLGGGNELSLTSDNDGNIYVVGNFKDSINLAPGLKNHLIRGTGDRDLFIVKLDSTGSIIWSKGITGKSETDCMSIQVLDSSIYLIGSFYDTVDFNPGKAKEYLVSKTKNYNDGYILRLDLDGNFIWARAIHGSYNVNIHSLTTNSNEELFITGFFGKTAEFDSSGIKKTISSAGNYDVFVAKYNIEGDAIWVRSVGGTENDVGNAIKLDDHGHIYITGFYSNKANFDPNGSSTFLKSNGKRDVFILKLDSSGNYIWAKSIGGISDDYGLSLTNSASGLTFITGYFQDSIDLDPDKPEAPFQSLGGKDIFILCLDTNGYYLWGRTCGSKKDDVAHSVVASYNNHLYITGTFQDTLDLSQLNHQSIISKGNSDIFLLHIDTSNTLVNAHSYGSTNSDIGYLLHLNKNRKLVLIGGYSDTIRFIKNSTKDSLVSVGGNDIIIFHYNNCQKYSTTYIQTTCNEYSLPNGFTIHSSGKYQDTVQTSEGCDSILTFYVNFHGPIISTDTIWGCDSIYFHGNWHFMDTVFSDTLQYTTECDSAIHNFCLKIGKTSYASDSLSACDSLFVKNKWHMGSAILLDTFNSISGCDSVVELKLLIRSKPTSQFNTWDICQSDSAKFKNNSINADSFLWVWGDGSLSNKFEPSHFYTLDTNSSETFIVKLITWNLSICRDTSTQAITVNSTPTSDFIYTTKNDTIECFASDHNCIEYAWQIDNNIAKVITGYHLIQDSLNLKQAHQFCLSTRNSANCVSDTTCKTISFSSNVIVVEGAGTEELILCPNPTSNNFYIKGVGSDEYTCEIYSASGFLLFNETLAGVKDRVLKVDLSPGTYTVRVHNHQKFFVRKLIIINN